jgi:hypothetical protein
LDGTFIYVEGSIVKKAVVWTLWDALVRWRKVGDS